MQPSDSTFFTMLEYYFFVSFFLFVTALDQDAVRFPFSVNYDAVDFLYESGTIFCFFL